MPRTRVGHRTGLRLLLVFLVLLIQPLYEDTAVGSTSDTILLWEDCDDDGASTPLTLRPGRAMPYAASRPIVRTVSERSTGMLPEAPAVSPIPRSEPTTPRAPPKVFVGV